MGTHQASRREALRLLLGAGLASAFSTKRVEAGEKPTTKRPVRYFLLVFASGGIDSIYTTDPKTRAAVEPWVDVPFSANAIVSSSGIPLGPHLASLSSISSRLALINGVRVMTANHTTGAEQFFRLRTNVDDRTPHIVDIIGRYRDTQLIGNFDTSHWVGTNFTESTGPGLLARLESLPADQLSVMSEAIRSQATRVRDVSPETFDTLGQAASFLEHLPKVPKFVEESWSPVPQARVAARAFQRAAWAFQHDIARCAFVPLRGLLNPWDSHNFNEKRQTMSSGWTFPMLARLVQFLAKTSNQHGPLIENTTILLASDVGRFPRLNGALGKDHFPELPVLMCGAGVNTGSSGAVYGGTDRRMASLPISLTTGRPERGGYELLLDDIGATLLHLAGIRDPSLHGYTGKVLPFLV